MCSFWFSFCIHLNIFSNSQYFNFQMLTKLLLMWWSLLLLSVVVAVEYKDEDYVWMTDPQTHERYQVLRSSYDRDKAFVVGESTLSNRFSHAYLDALANQCDAVDGPPSLFEFFNHTSVAIAEFCFHPEIYSYSFEIYLRLFETIRWGPYGVAALVAIGFTIARYLCTQLFLRVSLLSLLTLPNLNDGKVSSLLYFLCSGLKLLP